MKRADSQHLRWRARICAAPKRRSTTTTPRAPRAARSRAAPRLSRSSTDSGGCSRGRRGTSDLVEEFAYDLAGNLVYASDKHEATVHAYDVHGRAIATRYPEPGATQFVARIEWIEISGALPPAAPRRVLTHHVAAPTGDGTVK